MATASEKAEPDGQEPSGWQVLGPLMDLVTPMAVRVAATLRLADHLREGPLPVEELARLSSTDADALGRLLRHLVCQGMFTEPSQGTFGDNDIAALLRTDHPATMRAYLDLDGFFGQMDIAFTGLLRTIRTGQPAWESVFGAPFWQYLDRDPAMGASFDAAMAIGMEQAADEANGYDWSAARHVVDVGGGTGTMLAAVLEANPGALGTLVDLPETVERGRLKLAARGLAGRCTFVGQSFFDPLPTGGDVYVLCRVIHDWDDERAVTILRRCAEAAGDTGRVVLIEGYDSTGDPAAFAEMNLRMLVLSGGRERSIEAYTALAAEAGLSVAGVHPTRLGHLAIECVPC
ncbi:methyltransferase [Nocardia cyriacigeorgica]|uniref:Methyltransferase n=1 Tax=Nocardia cyriacigeorgica TaxID=135487 RepID=A0A6P1DDZ2_9NOCA|nr:methyltransferase [Nocardia cyriacigeorgica]NEW47364.1 methyltransferase [Nocardia cyriacigeorgica]NEW56720.1 methyltransferase [Nocardia cyriacigeorgica]